MRRFLPLLMWLWNFWPPFAGAGIRLTHIRPDLMGLEVRLKSRLWTLNPMGTQFGGSIFAMTDPFFVGIFRLHLARDIHIWDRAASIRFRRPSSAELHVIFEITPAQLADVRDALAERDQLDWSTSVEVRDSSGAVVAVVDKTIAFRRRASKALSNPTAELT